MNDSIICPHCKQRIPLSEAITHQIGSKYEDQIEEVKKKAEEREQYLIELSKKRIEEEKEKSRREAEVDLRKKVREEMSVALKNTQNESEELKKEKEKLQDQLLEISKTMRQLQNQTREKELEMEKRFSEEQEKLRKEEHRRIEEQFKLKDMEKDQKLQEVIKANEELRRKLEQGSQQMQGEVLELAIEEMLKKEFPYDEIKPVPKGINGGDIIHVVRHMDGRVCGTIIWEMKRTKSWSPQWVSKLKDDQRTVHAELAVIISQVIPDSIKRFGFVDGVWVCDYDCIIGVAYALRNQLVKILQAQSAIDGKKGKADILYNYITSTEFRHRMETIVEAFHGMQEEVEKEKRWFAQKWAREEKNLRKVMDNTYGMDGELQSIMGKSLSELEGVAGLPSLPDETDEEDSRLL
jgi:hypothetical protein